MRLSSDFGERAEIVGDRVWLQVVHQAIDFDDLPRGDRHLGPGAEGAVGPGQEVPESLVRAGAAAELAAQAAQGASAHIARLAQAVEQGCERLWSPSQAVDRQPCLEQ